MTHNDPVRPFSDTVEVFDSRIGGKGLRAVRTIAAGERILWFDDSDVINERRPLRPELGESEYHCDMVQNATVVLLKSPERYVNHCCEPNSFCRTIGQTRYLLARREIARGEEIVTDYCVNSAMPGFEWRCDCGAARCRGVMRLDFFSLPLDLQREYLTMLDDWFLREHEDRLRQLQLI